MAKLLQFNNQSVLSDSTEVSMVKVATGTGSSVTVTVNDNGEIADNDYILFGELGEPKTEIAQVNATVSGATTFQVDTLLFAHPAGTVLRKLNYNQVEISRSATIAGTKTVLATVALDVDNLETTYSDSTNTEGFAFFRLKNVETTSFSGYSAGVSYATATSTTREKIKQMISAFYSKPVDLEVLDMLIDETEKEVFSLRNWKWREKTWTFNTIASTQTYTKASITAEDLAIIVSATYDGDPVQPTFMKTFQAQNWDSSTTGNPITIFTWNDTIYLTPTPSAVKSVVIWGYKNSSGFSDDTSETGLEIASTISYKVLQDLWAPVDMNKSSYYGGRYAEKIKLMTRNDKSQVGVFGSLTHSEQVNSFYDQVEYPNVITT